MPRTGRDKTGPHPRDEDAGRRTTSWVRSLGWHPDSAVDADDLGVHVGIGDALDHHRGQLVGGAQALGEQHALAELRLECLGLLALAVRSEEHTSELQSLMRISYALFCLKQKNTK